MNKHSCLICIGSNLDRQSQLAAARKALTIAFPDIRFGAELETEAIGENFLSPFSNQLAQFSTSLSPEDVRKTFKEIEQNSGRAKEDKIQGIVKLDIDLLIYNNTVLKPEDLKKDFIRKELGKIKLL